MNIKQKMQEEMEEDPQQQEPVKLYLEEAFQSYVKEKYLVESPQILNNPTIMQMIYALEWYDIPRTAYSELIEYHPYLTRGDNDKLYYINTQHNIENSISYALFALVLNRVSFAKTKIFKRRVFRFPFCLSMAAVMAYGFNIAVLRPMYLNDIQQMGLDQKYFYLDLNADLMRDDLQQMGINVEAKYFNLEQTEQRLSDKTSENEAK